MKKIFKLTIFTLLLFFSVATIAVSSFAWYVSIIIVYYNYEDGSEAAPTYREKDPVYGVTYHIDSPKIEGYKPDMEYVEYTYAGTKAFWVTYYADGYNLIINYLDEDGNKISDSYNKILSKDSNYEIESPIIDGYIADQEVVSGTLDSDKEINVIYTRNKFNLTINYKDIDGNTVSNSYKETLIKNTEYNIESPYIEGHSPNYNSISGTLDSDKEYDVIYTKNTYSLTINYLDQNGNNIKESSIYEYKYNDNYNIKLPEIDGYQIDEEYVSGIIKDNKVIDLIYTANKHNLVINYIDEANNTLCDSYNATLDYNTEYNIKLPDVYGFSPYQEYANGILKEDTIINMMYSRNDYTIIINYVDSEGNPLADRYYASMKYESTFDVPSPIIYGYTARDNNISGVLNKNLEYTVLYDKNDYTLTIKFIDEEGNQLLDNYVEVLEYNTEYNIDVPSIDGYNKNINNVFGTLTRDTEITVLYRANYYNLVIYCIDSYNNNLINTYTYTLRYNENYEIVTPVIEGFYTNDKLVCGAMNNEGIELNIYYHEYKAPYDGTQVMITVALVLTNMTSLLFIAFDTLGKHVIR